MLNAVFEELDEQPLVRVERVHCAPCDRLVPKSRLHDRPCAAHLQSPDHIKASSVFTTMDFDMGVDLEEM